MFVPTINSRILERVATSDAAVALGRSLGDVESTIGNIVSRSAGANWFADGSGPVDYFFAALCFALIPAGIVGNFFLFRHLHMSGRRAQARTPFGVVDTDEVVKGLTLKQVAAQTGANIVGGVKKLLTTRPFGRATDSNGARPPTFVIHPSTSSSTLGVPSYKPKASHTGPITTHVSLPPSIEPATTLKRPINNPWIAPRLAAAKASFLSGINVTTRTSVSTDGGDNANRSDDVELAEVIDISRSWRSGTEHDNSLSDGMKSVLESSILAHKNLPTAPSRI